MDDGAVTGSPTAENGHRGAERVVVAVTGGPESETLIRRGAAIAQRSGADLLVVHVVTASGSPGPAELGQVRDAATRLGGSMHDIVDDDVVGALLGFASRVGAGQLVIGTSRRTRWERLFREGFGAAVLQRGGSLDVHMVTHSESRRGLRWPSTLSRRRHLSAWLAAVVVPPFVCGLILIDLDRVLGVGGKTALFFVGVLVVGLAGGIAPALVSAVLSSLLLNYFLTDPRGSFTIAEPDAVVTEMVLLVVAAAVAILVDGAARRSRDAGRAAREASLLTLFAGSVLRGADLETLLDRVRETYTQRAMSMLRQRPGEADLVVGVGVDPPASIDAADTVIPVGDDEFWLLSAGHRLDSRDRRVLSAVANQAAGLVRQRELRAAASRAEALAEADNLRRALLSAVSHDLRTPLAAAKAASSSLRGADDVGFSPADTAELLATVDESIDQLTALVGNLLDSSRLAAGVVRPTLSPVYLEETVQRALVSIGTGATGFAGVDRVEVSGGDVVVLADSGLLERVLANLVDNALRYAPESTVRLTAAVAGDRVHIAVADDGPGIAPGAEQQIFGAFQRLGDRDNTSGVGLGLSVARGFVEAMGGTITATETPGGGLTVVVDLAAAPEGGIG